MYELGLVTGKASAAYAALDSQDYDKVMTAVLHRYEVNEESYQLRLRQEKKKPEESYRAWVCRTANLLISG